ncbi:MAG: hypothetical protein AABX11_07350 [Nanoarchaeota archaeon]
MRLEELSISQVAVVLDSWERNFGFFYGQKPSAEYYLESIKEFMSQEGYYEDRFGTSISRGLSRGNNDAKLRLRFNQHEDLEIRFDVNQGSSSAVEFDPVLGKAEKEFKKDVEEVGFIYYTS